LRDSEWIGALGLDAVSVVVGDDVVRADGVVVGTGLYQNAAVGIPQVTAVCVDADQVAADGVIGRAAFNDDAGSAQAEAVTLSIGAIAFFVVAADVVILSLAGGISTDDGNSAEREIDKFYAIDNVVAGFNDQAAFRPIHTVQDDAGVGAVHGQTALAQGDRTVQMNGGGVIGSEYVSIEGDGVAGSGGKDGLAQGARAFVFRAGHDCFSRLY